MERNPFKRITRWFQQTTPTSTAIVSQPSPEELERQEEEKKRRKREEIRPEGGTKMAESLIG